MSAGRVACDHAERAERVERQTTHHSVGGWYGMGRAGWGWGGDGVGMGCGGMLTHVCWTRCLRPPRESGTDGKTNYTPVDVMGWV